MNQKTLAEEILKALDSGTDAMSMMRDMDPEMWEDDLRCANAAKAKLMDFLDIYNDENCYLWVKFDQNTKEQTIRKWDKKPFEGGNGFVSSAEYARVLSALNQVTGLVNKMSNMTKNSGFSDDVINYENGWDDAVAHIRDFLINEV